MARIDFPDKKFAASMSGAIELDPEAKTIKCFNQENGRVFVHPSSTVFDAQGFPGNSVYMSYFSKMATSKVFIRDLTRMYTYLNSVAATNMSHSIQRVHCASLFRPNYTGHLRSWFSGGWMVATSWMGKDRSSR